MHLPNFYQKSYLPNWSMTPICQNLVTLELYCNINLSFSLIFERLYYIQWYESILYWCLEIQVLFNSLQNTKSLVSFMILNGARIMITKLEIVLKSITQYEELYQVYTSTSTILAIMNVAMCFIITLQMHLHTNMLTSRTLDSN